MMKWFVGMCLMLMAMVTTVPVVSAQSPTSASAATPSAVDGPITLVFVERATADTKIDIGEPGQSTGDMQVWGPNQLYDENNENDTGATAQGFCVMFNESGVCLATETIVLADGSTIQLQGIQQADGTTVAAIVGGTGQYVGAYGSEEAHPNDDFSLWTHTLTIWS